MKNLAKIAAATLIALGAGTLSATADSCSGHSHDAATAGGAVGGGLIGNSIARSSDCNHHSYRRQSYYIDRDGHRHYYR